MTFLKISTTIAVAGAITLAVINPTVEAACVAQWGTCGGEHYDGPICCSGAGNVCQKQGKYYSQCRPDCPEGWECFDKPAETSTASPTPSPTIHSPISGSSSEQCVAKWGTCGGERYNGPTCCQAGLQCYREHRWYSQCLDSCPSGWDCESSPTTDMPTSRPTLHPTSAPMPTAQPTASPPQGTYVQMPNTRVASLTNADYKVGGSSQEGGWSLDQCAFRCDESRATSVQNQQPRQGCTIYVFEPTTGYCELWMDVVAYYSIVEGRDSDGYDTYFHESSVGPFTNRPTTEPTIAEPATRAPTSVPTGVTSIGSSFVAEHGKLTLNGVQLVDENNEAVQLMGMSSHGLHWFPDCYTKESIQYLVDNWNINVFRAAMYVDEGGYLSQKETLKQRVSDIVDWCEEIGIYVLIDWHILTPGNPQVSQDESIEFWQEMVAKYVDKKHVLYEIANEPNGCDWVANIKPYHDAVISSIREIDADTIIIAGTPNWSQFLWDAEANPVAQPYNVMYSFHFYSGTHTNWDQIATYLTKIPVFVTEWGTSEASGDKGPYLDNARTWLDTFAGTRVDTGGVVVSWLNWSYADKSETSGALRPGACPAKNWGDVSDSGAFVRDYILEHSFW